MSTPLSSPDSIQPNTPPSTPVTPMALVAANQPPNAPTRPARDGVQARDAGELRGMRVMQMHGQAHLPAARVLFQDEDLPVNIGNGPLLVPPQLLIHGNNGNQPQIQQLWLLRQHPTKQGPIVG